MSKFMAEFLVGSSASTKKTMASLYKNHFREDEKLETLLEEWLEKELAPASISKLFTLYRAWHLYKFDKEPRNFTRLKRRVSRNVKNGKKLAWTREQAEKALDVAFISDKPLYETMLFALHTGVRKGELFGLTWHCVDLFSGYIEISRSWDEPATKTGAVRYVPMSPDVEKLLSGKFVVGCSGLVFDRFEPNCRLSVICKNAEVPHLTFHGLRHTFATLALEAGESPRKVAEILGHSRTSTTIDFYWGSQDPFNNFGILPRRKHE